MNWTLIAAGMLISLLAVGHLAGGIPFVLRPMLQSDTPPMPKAVQHSVFHMISVFLFLAGGAYLIVGSGLVGHRPALIGFVSVCCLVFGLCQLVIGIIRLPRGWLQVWQWMVFGATGALGLWGLM